MPGGISMRVRIKAAIRDARIKKRLDTGNMGEKIKVENEIDTTSIIFSRGYSEYRKNHKKGKEKPLQEKWSLFYPRNICSVRYIRISRSIASFSSGNCTSIIYVKSQAFVFSVRHSIRRGLYSAIFHSMIFNRSFISFHTEVDLEKGTMYVYVI
ncbi:MAG: hypothetical protein WAW59_00070 [Patescibacteria group bacterium]